MLQWLPRAPSCHMPAASRRRTLGMCPVAVELDPRTNFAVLCPNCHSVIHRMDDLSNVAGLKALLSGAGPRSTFSGVKKKGTADPSGCRENYNSAPAALSVKSSPSLM